MAVTQAKLRRALRRLPLRRRWTCGGTPFDWDFSAKSRALRPLDSRVYQVPLKPAWRTLLIFGEYDYAEGGGTNPFIGARSTDGMIWGLDPERDRKPMFLLNSTLDAFVDTFQALDAYLGAKQPLPADIDRTLRAIDKSAFGRSDWKPFVAFVRAEQEG